MTLDSLPDALAVALSAAAVALGLRKHGAAKQTAQADARLELGRRYAALALDAVAAKGEMKADLRKRAELDAFRLIDTAADGRRDFTEAQAAQFLDAERLQRAK